MSVFLDVWLAFLKIYPMPRLNLLAEATKIWAKKKKNPGTSYPLIDIPNSHYHHLSQLWGKVYFHFRHFVSFNQKVPHLCNFSKLLVLQRCNLIVHVKSRTLFCLNHHSPQNGHIVLMHSISVKIPCKNFFSLSLSFLWPLLCWSSTVNVVTKRNLMPKP